MDVNLQIKITALVEGLKEVAQLGQSLLGAGESAQGLEQAARGLDSMKVPAEGASKSIKGVETALGDTSRQAEATAADIAAALNGISGKAIKALTTELEVATKALYELGAKSDLNKLAVSFGAAKAKVRDLEDELQLARKALEDLGKQAGFDPASDAVQELLKGIQRLDQELSTAKSSLLEIGQASSGMNEMAVAVLRAENTVRDLSFELEQAKSSLQEMSATTGFDPVSVGAQDAAKAVEDLQLKLLGAQDDLKALQGSDDAFASISNEAESAAKNILKVSKELEQTVVASKKAADAASATDKAFQALGGRSTSALQAEIKRVQLALEAVKTSTSSTAEDIARATQLAEARIRALNQELQSPAPKTFAQRFEDIKSKLKDADFQGAADEVNQLTEGLGGLMGVGSKLIGVWAAMKAINWLGDKIGETVQYGIEATKLAARVETLGITLDQVGRNAGYSADGLARAEQQVMKLGITTQAARSSLTQMIQAGIGVNDLGVSIAKTGERMTKAQELARAAQDLAVVSGQNSSETLERMVLNIQQMDTMGLKFMGLTVDREAANEAFAASLNKSASALSESEKKQAFYNATMREANKLTGTYEAAMDSAGKKAQSMARYQEELSRTLGVMLLPAYGGLIDAQTEYFKGAEKVAAEFAKNDTAAIQLGGSIKELGSSISSILVSGLRVGLTELTALSRLFTQIVDLATPVVDFIAQIGEGIDAWGELTGIDNLLGKLDPISGLINGIALAVAVVKDALSLAFAGAIGVVSNFVEALANTWIVLGKGIGLLNKDWGDAIQKAGQEMKGMAIAASEGATEIEKKVLSAEGAVGKFATSFTEGAQKVRESKEYVDSYSASIEALTMLQRTGQISAKDLNSAWSVLNTSLDVLRKTGQLSEKDFQNLGKQMMAVPGVLEKTYSEAAAAAKTSLSLMKADISEAMSAGVKYFQVFVEGIASGSEEQMKKMGTSAASMSEDILRVYTKVAEGAKTMNELLAVDAQLLEARKAGIIKEEEYAQALEVTATKFRELVDQSLKTARTKQDFADLTLAVQKLGEQGQLSGADVVESLRKIAGVAGTKLDLDKVETILKNLETQGKLSGTGVASALQSIAKEAQNSRDAVKLLNSQLEAVGQQSLKIGQAHLGVVTAEVGVAKSRVDLWVAQNKYAQTGNDLDRLGVVIAQTELKIAQQQLELARVRYEEEKTGMQLLIALQREKNALVALEKNATDELALAQLSSARASAADNEAKLSGLRQQSDKMQEQVLSLQEQQVKAKGMQEAMTTVQRATDGAGRSMGTMRDYADGAGRSVNNLSSSLGQASSSFGMLGQQGDVVAQAFSKVEGAATKFGIAGSTAGSLVSGALSGVASGLDRIYLGYARAETAAFTLSGATSQYGAGATVSIGGVSNSMEGLISRYNDLSGSTLVWKNSVNESASDANTRISEMALNLRGLSSTFSNVGDDAWVSLGRTTDSVGAIDKAMTDLVSRTQEMGSGYDFMAGKSSSWSDSAREDLEKVRQSYADLEEAARAYMESATGLDYGAGGYGAPASGINGGSNKPGSTGYGGNTPGYYGNMRVGADGTIGGVKNQDTRKDYEKGAAYDKDNYSLNTEGQRVVAVGETRTSIFNQLKSYGVEEEKAAEITKEFLDSQGNVPYFDNAGQMKYGGPYSTIGYAIQQAAQKAMARQEEDASSVMTFDELGRQTNVGNEYGQASANANGTYGAAGWSPFVKTPAPASNNLTQVQEEPGIVAGIPPQPKEYSPTGWVYEPAQKAWKPGLDLSGTGSVAPVQSVALPSSAPVSSAVTTQVAKTIVVQLKEGMKSLSLNMDENDEDLLTEFLTRMQLSHSAGS